MFIYCISIYRKTVYILWNLILEADQREVDISIDTWRYMLKRFWWCVYEYSWYTYVTREWISLECIVMGRPLYLYMHGFMHVCLWIYESEGWCVRTKAQWCALRGRWTIDSWPRLQSIQFMLVLKDAAALCTYSLSLGLHFSLRLFRFFFFFIIYICMYIYIYLLYISIIG